jgi:uncharacterized coiled-coil DUF342 family protein
VKEGNRRLACLKKIINDAKEGKINEDYKKFETAAIDRADIRGAIAELSAQVRDYHNEMKFMSHQLDKLRDAILQIAKEVGVKLKVEI